jgi:hypothetical protein
VEGGKNPDDSRLAEAVTAAALGTNHQQTNESKSSRAIGAYAQIITARVGWGWLSSMRWMGSDCFIALI